MGAGTDAVGGEAPEFHLAGFVGEGEEGFAVPDERGLAVAHAALAGGLDEAAGAGGRDEDLPARGEGDAVAGGRQGNMGEVVDGLRHPFLAGLVEVGGEGDRDDGVATGGEIEQPEIGAVLVNDATAAEAGIFDAEVGVLRVLAEIGTVGQHRPEVHRAVPVAGEVETAGGPERPAAGAGVAGGERRGGGVAGGEAPEVLRGAAFVALEMAALRREAGEEERLAGVVVGALVGLRERDERARAGDRVDGDELARGQGRVMERAVEDAAVGRPAAHESAGGLALVGEPGDGPAGEGHDADLGLALVLCAEGDGLAVGRDSGELLGAGMGGETPGRAAGDADGPEVALGGEDDRVAGERGKTVVAGAGGRGFGAGGDGDGQGEKRERNETAAGNGGNAHAIQHERAGARFRAKTSRAVRRLAGRRRA